MPYAPGVVTTEMMRDKNNSIPSDKWSKIAVPFILGWKSEQNGASMVTPNAYSKEYQSTWIIPDGMPISKEELQGHRLMIIRRINGVNPFLV